MLINNIADLKKFITVDASVEITSVMPYIQQSEQRYIIKVLGPALYKTLDDAYAASTRTNMPEPLTDDLMALWTQVNMANANFAWYLYFPIANIRISEKGLVTSSTQETQQITKWMFDEAYLTLKRSAYNAIDGLYNFLAAGNVPAPDTPSWYAAWSSGPGFSDYVDLFVNTAEVFSNLTPINNSRWMYTQMRSHLKRAEQLYARDFIGAAFFDHLKSVFKDGSADSDEKVVIQSLQDILSLMAYSMAITDPNIRQEITVVEGSQMDNIPSVGSNRADVDNRTSFDRVANKYASQAGQLMDQLRNFLNATATTAIYPLYYTSPLYVDPNAPQQYPQNDNCGRKTFFII